VVANARAASKADRVVIQNLTFDPIGDVPRGPFDTISTEGATETTIDHVILIGDGRTGSAGGHIELNGSVGTVVDSCLVEHSGNCGPEGHRDHRPCLASTQDAVIRSSIVRGHASRGIQSNVQQGECGTSDGVVIEHDRAHRNGHAEHEDGIAVNGEDTGDHLQSHHPARPVPRRPDSGLRLVGAAPSDSRVDHHTFAGNGSGSSGESRFEPDLDDGSGAGTAVSRNICAVGCQVRNDCYRAAGFSLEDNVVFGADATGDCNGGSIAADPQSAAAAADDCHPNNAAVAEPAALRGFEWCRGFRCRDHPGSTMARLAGTT